MPADGAVAGGVIVNAGTPAMLTVTEADVGLVAPVVGVPVVGGGVVVDPPDVPPIVAVTVAVDEVLSVDVATPFPSVVARTESSEPDVVVKETGTPASWVPLMSNTVAEISDDPPSDGISVGLERDDQRVPPAQASE